ncbi:MAG: hypothetical protein ACKO35_09565 [Planctomycetaceae bacterium]
MGIEAETAGAGSASYEMGQFQNTLAYDAYTTEGLFFEFVFGGAVTVVAPLDLTVLTGFGVEWNTLARHIELHGVSHWLSALKDGWNQRTTNFSATSVGSHCQTVDGYTRWKSNGNFAIVAPTAGASVAIVAEAADGGIELSAGDGADVGSLTLASTKAALSSAGEVKVTGTQSVSVQSGLGAVNVAGQEVSLKCNAAGITATAASVTISGDTVQIGVPGQPNTAQVATVPGVEASMAPLGDATAAIAQLRTKLADLQEKIGKSRMLSYLLK